MDETLCYLLLSASAVMFGGQFFFNDMFRKHYGNSFRASLVSKFGGGVFGLIALALINGLTFEYSHFSLIMAIFVNINAFLLTFCGLKALGKINLSLYSMFMMLGGMALPFVSGILFHGESLTLGKLICFLFIIASLLVVLKRDNVRSGGLYYAGIFILNGMSGVLSKLYKAAPAQWQVSSAGYSMLIAILSLVLTGIFLLIFGVEKKKLNFKAVIAMAGSGIINRVANLFLLIALATVPASAQYPFITGGTMIVSTLLSFFTDKKPSKREIIAVIISFIGILFLLFIPDIKLI